MFFDNWQAFIDMGGYGFYVWLSFGVCVLSMMSLWIQTRSEKRRLITDIKADLSRRERIAKAMEQSDESKA